MDKIAASILIITLTAVTCIGQVHLSGPLSGVLEDTTYIVDDSISVQPDDSLVIEPGAVFFFSPFSSFRIHGCLSAIGTENDTIMFLPLTDSWEGLTYSESAYDSNKMHYCLVSGSIESGVILENCYLSLQNTVIKNNYADNGAGIRLENANITMLNSSIRDNNADNYGGGINATGSTLNITASEVSYNRAIQAGGMYLNGSILYLTDSAIEYNEATMYDGGGIYATENSYLSFNEINFHANFSDDEGGGVFAGWGTSAIVQNCYFTNNMSNSVAAFAAESAGNYILIDGCEFLENEGYLCGGINFCFCDCWIENSLFDDNFSSEGASAIRTWNNDTFEINSCTFTNNRSIDGAGALLFIDDNPLVSNSLFQNNISEYGGGAVHFFESNGSMENCQILGNTSINGCGGGIKLESSDADFVQCLISDNEAVEYGGGVYIVGNEYPSMDRCTISGNVGGLQGGGVYHNGSFTSVYNTIVALNINDGVWFGEDGYLSFSFSDIFGNQGGDLVGNVPSLLGVISTTNANGDSCDIYQNIFFDPMFVNATTGDFNLQWGSPCIDAGDPASPLDPDSSIADIGAFYYDQSTPQSIQDLTITINSLDVALNWSPVPNADSYNIYRSDTPYFDITTLTPVANVDVNEYIDSGAVSSGKWFYVVTAISGQ